MLKPEWLNDSSVKVYAAEHLPVVRVTEHGAYVFACGSFNAQPALSGPVHAAWKRLLEAHEVEVAPEIHVSMAEPGFYYLKPALFEVGGYEVDPPVLVPCEDVTALAGPYLPDYAKSGVRMARWAPYAALVFHLPERACDNPANVQVGTVCPDCNDTGTLPEQIHVETREDGET